MGDQRKKWRMVRKIKTSISPRELCKGYNQVYYDFIKKVKRIKYDQRPPYTELKKIFQEEIMRVGVSKPQSISWDWSTLQSYVQHECHEIGSRWERYTAERAIGPLKDVIAASKKANKKSAKRKSQMGASSMWPENQQLVSLSYATH